METKVWSLNNVNALNQQRKDRKDTSSSSSDTQRLQQMHPDAAVQQMEETNIHLHLPGDLAPFC